MTMSNFGLEGPGDIGPSNDTNGNDRDGEIVSQASSQYANQNSNDDGKRGTTDGSEQHHTEVGDNDMIRERQEDNQSNGSIDQNEEQEPGQTDSKEHCNNNNNNKTKLCTKSVSTRDRSQRDVAEDKEKDRDTEQTKYINATLFSSEQNATMEFEGKTVQNSECVELELKKASDETIQTVLANVQKELNEELKTIVSSLQKLETHFQEMVGKIHAQKKEVVDIYGSILQLREDILQRHEKLENDVNQCKPGMQKTMDRIDKTLKETSNGVKELRDCFQRVLDEQKKQKQEEQERENRWKEELKYQREQMQMGLRAFTIFMGFIVIMIGMMIVWQNADMRERLPPQHGSENTMSNATSDSEPHEIIAAPPIVSMPVPVFKSKLPSDLTMRHFLEYLNQRSLHHTSKSVRLQFTTFSDNPGEERPAKDDSEVVAFVTYASTTRIYPNLSELRHLYNSHGFRRLVLLCIMGHTVDSTTFSQLEDDVYQQLPPGLFPRDSFIFTPILWRPFSSTPLECDENIRSLENVIERVLG